MDWLYHMFFQRLPIRDARADSNLETLNIDERAHIRAVHRRALFLAALFDLIAYVLYYLPISWFPALFPSETVTLPFVDRAVTLAWGKLIWAFVLTYAEIYALVLLNIAGTHEIAVATGYINADTKAARTPELVRIGTAYKARVASRYGIDPYRGINHTAIFLFLFVWRLKGWIGNQLIQYSLINLLGRFVLHELIDFAGMPLYMAINMWATNTVLTEARVVIMGQAIVDQCMRRIPIRNLSADGRQILYDTLQFIAVSKRDYHPNHDLLTERLIEHFGIPVESAHYVSTNYVEILKQKNDIEGQVCRLVIVLGYIFDGELSWRERRAIDRLHSRGILEERAVDVARYCDDFVDGAGVEPLLHRYLDPPH